MNDDLEHAMNVLHINREGVSRLVYWPRGYETLFMLNSAEQEIYPAYKC